MKNKIGILGGDLRQLALAEMFSLDGYECALWGVCGIGETDRYDGFVRCVDWKDAMASASAVILPLPLTTDGVRLNCPSSNDRSCPELRLTEIISEADRSCTLFAGKIPSGVLRFAAEHCIKMIDYYETEEFQIKNALPTAEGALAIAIEETSITLAGANTAVTGYGRIGRALAQRLRALGANVTCIARSRRDLAFAACDGCTELSLNDYKAAPLDFDVIFNTVPHVIFESEVLRKMRRGSLIIDLASMNGGVDIGAAEDNGIRVVRALSLPGRTAPTSAGRIIYDTVSVIMREEGSE